MCFCILTLLYGQIRFIDFYQVLCVHNDLWKMIVREYDWDATPLGTFQWWMSEIWLYNLRSFENISFSGLCDETIASVYSIESDYCYSLQQCLANLYKYSWKETVRFSRGWWLWKNSPRWAAVQLLSTSSETDNLHSNILITCLA